MALPVNSLIIFPLLLAAALPGAAASDTIQSKATGNGSFEITYIAYGTTDPFEAQRRLMPEATRLCAPRQVVLGKYRFTATESLTGTSKKPAPSVDLVQQVQCITGTASTGNATTPQPSEPGLSSPMQRADQDTRIVGLTEHYLEARAREDFDTTHALMDATQLDTIDEDAWRKNQRAFNRIAGESQARVVYRVTWYDDPRGTLPGRYAAADFVTLDSGLAFHCGYIAWRQHADGNFRVVREEDNYLDAVSAARMTKAEQQETKAKVGCPDVTAKPK